MKKKKESNTECTESAEFAEEDKPRTKRSNSGVPLGSRGEPFVALGEPFVALGEPFVALGKPEWEELGYTRQFA
jgi:hypothetical protein